MASYSYTFTGSNGAAWETGWHTVAGTVDIQSNKGRTLTAATTFAVAGAYFDGVALTQDTDYYIDAVIQTVTAAQFYAAVNIRANFTAFTDVKQHGSWHTLFVGDATSGYTVFYRINGDGTPVFLSGGPDKDFVQGDTLHMRFSPLGTRFRCKYWRNSDPEPGGWDIDYTDTGGAPTGNMMSLMVRNGGTDAVADDWRWDSLTVGAASTVASAGVASSTGTAYGASGGTTTAATAQVAVGTGAALFTVGGSSSLTLTAIDAVESHGTAGNVQQPHVAPVALGAGTAYNASVNISSGASGVIILDENGNPILDENGNPILDESTGSNAGIATGAGTAYNVTPLRSGNPAPSAATGTGAGNIAAASVGPTGTNATGAGAANAAAEAIKTSASVATGSGAAFAAGTQATGATNANAVVALGSGTVSAATGMSTGTAGNALSAGTANAAHTTISTNIGVALGLGVAEAPESTSRADTATGVGVAHGPNISIDQGTSISAAVIPIFASAAAPSIYIKVNASAATGSGVAGHPATGAVEPGQTVTVRDRGHTVSVKER